MRGARPHLVVGARTAIGMLVALLIASSAAAQVGGLTELPPPSSASPNLLKNGGFEPAAGGLAGWTANPTKVWSIESGGHAGQGSLRLTGADHESYIAGARQAVTLKAGTYTLEGWVKLQAVAEKDRNGVRLCLDGRPRLNWWKCTDIARGTADWKHLRLTSIVVSDPGPYRVLVGAYGRPTGTAWFDDVSLTVLRPAPLDAFLLYPNFRGLLLDDRPQTVRMSLATRGAPSGARVRVTIVDDAGGGAKVEREYPAAAKVTAELDAAKLPHGTYRVRSQLVGAGGEVLHAHPDYRIVKAPAAVRERFTVWVDEHNTTYLGGKPAFVLGLYNTTGYSNSPRAYAEGRDGWGDAKIAQAPINMLINYWLGVAPIPALEAYMDDLASRKMFYLQTVNFYHREDAQYAKIGYPAAKDGEDALNRWVGATLGKHKGLAGFYTSDEQPAQAVPIAFRQYRVLREAAPGTVAYAVLGNGWEEQAPLWRDAVDVLGLDPYPITRPAGQNDLAMVGRWTRLGRDAVQGSRPLWMVLQYFPLTGAAGWPRYEDLRAMSWMAIVEGARGLFYWSFGARGLAYVKDPAERERKWQELVKITREIKALEPVLLAPDAAVVARESSQGAVRALGKRAADGTRYLFAYNSRNTPVKVTWSLAEPAREVTDLDGTAAPTLAAGREFSTELGPFEIKRYRLR